MSFLFSQPAPGILPPDSVSFDELAEISANSILGNPTGTQANAVSVDSNLFFISTATNRIGIGSTSPNAKLQINNSGSQLGLAVYSTSSNNTAELYNQGTTNYTLALNSAANSAYTGASIGGYFARGTLSSRAQTLADDSLLSISASGHTGTAIAGISAAIVIAADQNTGTSAYGGQIVFATTPNNTAALIPTPRVIIKNDGKVNIADLTASSFAGSDASKNLVSLSSSTATSYLNTFTDLLQGVVPASGGGTTNFLRADGQWQPAGVSTVAGDVYKVLASNGTTTTWQYAGLGDGSYGTNNVILGRTKPASLSGTENTIVGAASATALTTGSSNVLLGKGAGSALTTGNYNTFVGNDAGSQQTTASNSVVVGQSNTIGTTAGLYYVLGNNNTCSGLGSISIGYDANAGTGRFNLTAGISSGTTTNTGEFNIFMGTNCAYGSVSNANSNVCIGYDAARQLSTGNENLILGHGAGYSISSGTYNVALGYYAGSNIGSRTETVSLGRNAGGSNTGSYSVFIGSYSGQNASAGNEFYLGNQNYANNTDEKAKSLIYGQFNATPASQTLTINAATTSTYGLIANEIGGDYDSRIEGVTDQNLVFVDASTDRVGIGTSTPSAKLEVNGDILATEVAVANYKLHPTSHSHTQNSSTSHNINWAAAPIEIITLNANITSLTFSNVVEGGAYLIKIIQGASGGPYTISWPTMKWLGGTPTLSTAANAVDVISLTYIGGEYLAVASLGFV